MKTIERLAADQWRRRQSRHMDRLRALAHARIERMSHHRKHPVEDFLFEYYNFRPAQLLRWSPGAGVVLEGASPQDLGWNEFVARDGGCVLLASAFPRHRQSFLEWAIEYLEGIRKRPPLFHCCGLHEWAMVYRAQEVRHTQTPLRLTPTEIALFIEREGLRCTHFDAYRFFTPEARPLNRMALARDNTTDHDQKGCLHVTMDLYKYAYKIAPWSSGELIADAFLLAWEARQLDMRASPYDLSDFGFEAIAIETRAGREEYVARQVEISRAAEPIREQLIAEYRQLRTNSRTVVSAS